MQQYPNYFNAGAQAVPPMYPNYNFQQAQVPNPYVDRYSQQQLAQAQQPQQQFQGLNGRIVDDFGVISANDVPMDAVGAIFIKSDGSEIQRRVWSSNGTISTISFKPFFDGQSNNLPQTEENVKFDLSEASTEIFMRRFDDITERLEKMEKNFGRAARIKKEAGAE